jgi:hypothetical protein
VHGGHEGSAPRGEIGHAPARPPAPPVEEAEGLREEVDQLRRALDSRAVIDQARGMVMALGSCSSQCAWDLLVQFSQNTNTKLREVAAALVATAEGQPLPAPLQDEIGRAFTRKDRSARPTTYAAGAAPDDARAREKLWQHLTSLAGPT